MNIVHSALPQLKKSEIRKILLKFGRIHFERENSFRWRISHYGVEFRFLSNCKANSKKFSLIRKFGAHLPSGCEDWNRLRNSSAFLQTSPAAAIILDELVSMSDLWQLRIRPFSNVSAQSDLIARLCGCSPAASESARDLPRRFILEEDTLFLNGLLHIAISPTTCALNNQLSKLASSLRPRLREFVRPQRTVSTHGLRL